MLVSNLRRATDFGIMTLDVEAGLGPAAGAFTRVLDGIRSKPIDQSPFPHIYIEEIFPPDYYRALLQRIAAVGRFVPTLYPGVGVDLSAKTFRDYGLTCENFAADDELAPLHAFLKSNRFTRTLLEKFSASNSWSGHGSAVPAEKHAHFADGRDDFACVFDLHKDLPGYEITPHADVTSKIITFLFYFTPDESINKFGTLLCRVRPGSSVEPAPVRRSALSSMVLRASRVLVGDHYGLTQKDPWLSWDKFEIVKTAEAKPNSLFVFAPNSRSFHAVRMDIPRDHPVQERQTLRGFIRSGKDSQNFTSGYSHKLGRKLAFGLARRSRALAKPL